jgi:hypothetical protein
LSTLGLTLIVAAPMLLTTRLTDTVCGLLLAPRAVMVIVPL